MDEWRTRSNYFKRQLSVNRSWLPCLSTRVAWRVAISIKAFQVCASSHTPAHPPLHPHYLRPRIMLFRKVVSSGSVLLWFSRFTSSVVCQSLVRQSCSHSSRPPCCDVIDRFTLLWFSFVKCDFKCGPNLIWNCTHRPNGILVPILRRRISVKHCGV